MIESLKQWALRQKSKYLGLDQWFENIPRNLRVLFELSDQSV